MKKTPAEEKAIYEKILAKLEGQSDLSPVDLELKKNLEQKVTEIKRLELIKQAPAFRLGF